MDYVLEEGFCTINRIASLVLFCNETQNNPVEKWVQWNVCKLKYSPFTVPIFCHPPPPTQEYSNIYDVRSSLRYFVSTPLWFFHILCKK